MTVFLKYAVEDFALVIFRFKYLNVGHYVLAFENYLLDMILLVAISQTG